MTAISRFLTSFQQSTSAVADGPWAITTRAAIAVVDVLPTVQGAVICLSQDREMRIPVGVSDGTAHLAEQLEYTVGDGPGLDAVRHRRHVVAGAALSERWPVFGNALACSTGYQAAQALPLPAARAQGQRGVLLLFYASTADADRITADGQLDLIMMTQLIGQALTVVADTVCSATECRAVGHRGSRRALVAQAVGMVMSAKQLNLRDGLAVLRGYAFARGRLVDDAAADIVSRRIPLHLLA